MPKLKPFDFTAIKEGDIKEAKKVLHDLLQLYPRGANRNLHKHNYRRLRNDAILETQCSVDVGVGSCLYASNAKASFWGYSSEQIYYTLKTLGAQGTYLCDYELADICRTHFGFQKGKRTRAGKRLALRLSGAWKCGIEGGSLGDMIFNASLESRVDETGENKTDYRNDRYRVRAKACVVANNKTEAAALFKTMFGFTAEISGIHGWQQGAGAEAMATNMTALASLRHKREDLENTIAMYKSAVDNIDALSEAIEVYTMTSFGEV